MRPLAIWLVVLVAVFGGLAIVAALVPEDEPERVFVVVDASFPMRPVWDQVGDELDRIDDRDNTQFALATEKRFVHGFQDQLRIGSEEPFAPCTFEGIQAHGAATEADRRILITTAASCDPSSLVGWELRILEP